MTEHIKTEIADGVMTLTLQRPEKKNALTGAMYVTVITDEDRNRANERLNAYLEQYYGQPAAVMRSRQACYAGPNGGLAEWLQGYARAGATHLVLRFAGDHERHLETVAALRSKLPR